VAAQERTGESAEEAARNAKVHPATVRRHKARARVLGKASGKPDASSRARHVPATGKAEHAQGSAVSGRPDLLELVRRILDARNPAARAELDEGLRVHVAGGEDALAPWLARPIAAVEIDRDELETLREALGTGVAIARKAEPGGPQLRALTIVERLAKTVSVVQTRRPREEKPDEVTARLERLDDEVHDIIEQTYSQAEELAARPRAASDADRGRAAEIGRLGAAGYLPNGCCITCGAPLVAPLEAAP
jgi:hypothetical protein